MPGDGTGAVATNVDRLWRILDTRGEGHLDCNGLKRGLTKLDHPLKNADDLLHDVIKAVDTDSDGKIQYHEFRTFIEETERELLKLFKSIDRNQDGKLDKGELRAAFSRAGLAVPNSKLDDFFTKVDSNHDGIITFDEWRNFLLFIPFDAPNLKAVLSYFSAAMTLNFEGDVQVSSESVQGLGTEPTFPSSFLGAIASVARPRTRYQPRRSPSAQKEAGKCQSVEVEPVQASVLPLPAPVELEPVPEPGYAWNQTGFWKPLLTSFPDPGYFLAGGIAGVVSRTATAPFDRLKVYLIAQTGTAQGVVEAAKQGSTVQIAKRASAPLIDAMKALWGAGGVRSLFAGNGLNVVKVIPESAIRFGSFEGAKRALARLAGHDDPKQLGGWSKFLAGGIGGIISQFSVYPIDTLKFQMQCETVAGGPRGAELIAATARKLWSKHGLRAYYRGLPMGLIGMFPYSAIDLGTFEYLKRRVTARNARRRRCHEEDAGPSGFATAGIGAVSGALGASAVYPLNVLRTRLQAQGTIGHPQTYTGIWDVTRKTVGGEGLKGLFRGLTPNLLKVVPAVSISYVVYENSKRILGLR